MSFTKFIPFGHEATQSRADYSIEEDCSKRYFKREYKPESQVVKNDQLPMDGDAFNQINAESQHVVVELK